MLEKLRREAEKNCKERNRKEIEHILEFIDDEVKRGYLATSMWNMNEEVKKELRKKGFKIKKKNFFRRTWPKTIDDFDNPYIISW